MRTLSHLEHIEVNMKLPSPKRLQKQDFPPEYAALIDALGFSLNNGIDSLYEALNKRLSITDNFLSSVKDVDLIVDSTGKVTSGGVFNLDFQGKVVGLDVIKADNLTNSSIYPTTAPWPSWEVTASNGIKLVNVTGLQPSFTYRLRVIAWGG